MARQVMALVSLGGASGPQVPAGTRGIVEREGALLGRPRVRFTLRTWRGRREVTLTVYDHEIAPY